jgi:hypothetical protein
VTRERTIEASAGAVQTLAQGQGQGQGLLLSTAAAWAEVLARQKEYLVLCCTASKGLETDVETMSLVTCHTSESDGCATASRLRGA